MDLYSSMDLQTVLLPLPLLLHLPEFTEITKWIGSRLKLVLY
jgi:hypothetical protein